MKFKKKSRLHNHLKILDKKGIQNNNAKQKYLYYVKDPVSRSERLAIVKVPWPKISLRSIQSIQKLKPNVQERRVHNYAFNRKHSYAREDPISNLSYQPVEKSLDRSITNNIKKNLHHNNTTINQDFNFGKHDFSQNYRSFHPLLAQKYSNSLKASVLNFSYQPIKKSSYRSIRNNIDKNYHHRNNRTINPDNNFGGAQLYPTHGKMRYSTKSFSSSTGANIDDDKFYKYYLTHIRDKFDMNLRQINYKDHPVSEKQIVKKSMNEVNNFNRPSNDRTKNDGTWPIMYPALWLVIPMILFVVISATYCLWKTYYKRDKDKVSRYKNRKKIEPYKNIKYHELKRNISPKHCTTNSLFDAENRTGDTSLASEDCLTNVKIPLTKVYSSIVLSERTLSQGTYCSCSIGHQTVKLQHNSEKCKCKGISNEFDHSSSTTETINSTNLVNEDWIPRSSNYYPIKYSQSQTAILNLLEAKNFVRSIPCLKRISFSTGNLELCKPEGSVIHTKSPEASLQKLSNTSEDSDSNFKDAICELPNARMKHSHIVKNDADFTDANQSNLEETASISSLSTSDSSDESLYYTQPFNHIIYEPKLPT